MNGVASERICETCAYCSFAGNCDRYDRTLDSIEQPACDAYEIHPWLDENRKLRERVEELEELLPENGRWFGADVVEAYVAEIKKLRELCADMWRFTGAACKKYPRLFDPPAQGGQMVQLNAIDAFEQRMAELEIGVDE
jgi:hypothetical protein